MAAVLLRAALCLLALLQFQMPGTFKSVDQLSGSSDEGRSVPQPSSSSRQTVKEQDWLPDVSELSDNSSDHADDRKELGMKPPNKKRRKRPGVAKEAF